MAFIRDAVPAKSRKSFADIIPALLQAVYTILESNDDTEAQDILQELIELADSSSAMFRQYSPLVTQVGLNIVNKTDFDDGALTRSRTVNAMWALVCPCVHPAAALTNGCPPSPRTTHGARASPRHTSAGTRDAARAGRA